MPVAKIGSADIARQIKFTDKPEWEEITWQTHRLKIAGGFLYRYGELGYGYGPSLVFVPCADVGAEQERTHGNG